MLGIIQYHLEITISRVDPLVHRGSRNEYTRFSRTGIIERCDRCPVYSSDDLSIYRQQGKTRREFIHKGKLEKEIM